MKVTRIKAGTYKVNTEKGIFIVRGGPSYNYDSSFFRNGGYEIWTANSDSECLDTNCWACGAPSKKIALQFIAEL